MSSNGTVPLGFRASRIGNSGDMGYGNNVQVFFQKQFYNSLYYLKFKTKNEIYEICVLYLTFKVKIIGLLSFMFPKLYLLSGSIGEYVNINVWPLFSSV